MPDAQQSQPAADASSRRGPRLRLLAALAWLAVVAAYPALLLAHLWPPALTETSRPYVLIGHAAFLVLVFQFHVGLALLPVPILAAATRRRRLLVLSLPLLLVTLAPALWAYRPRSSAQAPPGADTLSVMSANLLYSRASVDALADELAAHDPDIILFQEYSGRDRERLAGLLDGVYPHRVAVERDDAFGQAVYSKRPFLSRPRLYPPGNLIWTVPQITVRIDLGGVPVTLTNIHLLPPVSLEAITTHRLQAAGLAELAAAHLSRNESLVLAGDFNATPRSHHSRAMERAGLRECHGLAGWGRGATWPRTGVLAYAPGIRLDHVFISPDLVCLDARVGGEIGSDHRPVVARVARRAGMGAGAPGDGSP